MSKIIRIFLEFFFIEECDLRGTLGVRNIEINISCNIIALIFEQN